MRNFEQSQAGPRDILPVEITSGVSLREKYSLVSLRNVGRGSISFRVYCNSTDPKFPNFTSSVSIVRMSTYWCCTKGDRGHDELGKGHRLLGRHQDPCSNLAAIGYQQSLELLHI